jgi:N-acetylmuramic acid 6-phosphate etherase
MLQHLTTESVNPASERIDTLSSLEIVQLINQEDAKISLAVAKEADRIARAIDRIAQAFASGGRLIYLGAGTSGRLGVLDAAECPPTFRSDPNLVVGLIAGGRDALVRAIEGAEDNAQMAVADLHAIDFSSRDVLVGIATSGRTPYVLGGLRFAKQSGATTIGLVCNAGSEIEQVADWTICPVVGPEILSGSTRMKAGTATKMVLNMITTGAMIRIGKTYGNLMVDLRATNTKLLARAKRLVQTLAGVNESEATRLLESCQGEVKTAVVMHLRQVDATAARELLAKCAGRLREAIAPTA